MPSQKVACETLVCRTSGAGSESSKTYLDVQEIARQVIRDVGYTKSECMFGSSPGGIVSAFTNQAESQPGVDKGRPNPGAPAIRA